MIRIVTISIINIDISGVSKKTNTWLQTMETILVTLQ